MRKCTIYNILHRRDGQNILAVFATDDTLRKDKEEVKIDSPDWMGRWVDNKSLQNFLTFFVFSATNMGICASIYRMNPKHPAETRSCTNYFLRGFSGYHSDEELYKIIEEFVEGHVYHKSFRGEVTSVLPSPHKIRIHRAFEIAKELFGQHGDQSIFDVPRPKFGRCL